MKPSPLPIVQALLAAVLFGLSAPLSKLLLGEVQPVTLAALLYLGSGVGLAVLRLRRKAVTEGDPQEARIRGADVPWLLGAILFGGVLAPILLLVSLDRTPASTASLLLNLEAPATALIAALFFREAIGRQVGWAVGLVTAAGVLLSWQPGAAWGVSIGALGIAAASLFWGIDNNLTRNISARDPLSIVTWKGLGAGLTSLLIARVLGQPLPGPAVLAAALALGFFSYGFSIVLFIHAMRSLGAARASALFGAAPFVGALFSILLFWELPGGLFWLALPLMLGGAFLLSREKHEHPHIHSPVEHDHAHIHNDAHHHHDHPQGKVPADVSHSHPHTHTRHSLRHDHPHTPDLHHWHEHESS